MTEELPALLAKKFIARRDAKAVQRENDSYTPVREVDSATGRRDGPLLPWKMSDLTAHLSGQKSMGHYLIDPLTQCCKLFVFDIDLRNETQMFQLEDGTVQMLSPREAWRTRNQQVRSALKAELRTASHMLANKVSAELQIPTAVAYSGNKGVHVYGFTGNMLAEEVILAAQIVLEATRDDWLPSRGASTYQSKKYPYVDLEVYPKQGTVKPDSFGNLVRLPLGRNLKSKDTPFFVDMRVPMNQLVPLDPHFALTALNPWGDS